MAKKLKEIPFSQAHFIFDKFDSLQELIMLGKKLMPEYLRKYEDYSKYFVGDYDEALPEYLSSKVPDTESLEKGYFEDYQEQQLLDDVMQGFDEILPEIDMGEDLKKSKIKITDNPRGLFDFGLASIGLFTLKEFYSKELAKESPEEFPTLPAGVVDGMFVNKNEMGDYWYTSELKNKKYQVYQQDKGTAQAILDGYSKNDIPNSYKTFRTTQKKAYIEFEKKGGKARYVDLFVPVGGLSNMNPSGMLYRALPVIIASKLLEGAGIRTRIIASRAYINVHEGFEVTNGYNYYSNKNKLSPYVMFNYTIKNYSDSIDFTQIAVNTADTRVFRHILWKFMPPILAMNHHNLMYGHGVTIYDTKKLLDIGGRYKNWYYSQIESGKDWTKVAKPLMIFGGIPNPSKSWSYNPNFKSDSNKKIMDEVYRIIDTIDFYYNDAEKPIQRIFDRFKKDNGYVNKYSFEQYIDSLLINSHFPLANGQYKDTPEELKEKREYAKQKLQVVNKLMDKLDFE